MLPIPRNDYVLIRRVKPESITPSGLYIPDTAQENRMETRIEAIGPGAFLSSGQRCTEPMSDLKVGMKVLVSKYGGVAVEGHDDLFLVREGEITSRLDPPSSGQPEKTKEKR